MKGCSFWWFWLGVILRVCCDLIFCSVLLLKDLCVLNSFVIDFGLVYGVLFVVCGCVWNGWCRVLVVIDKCFFFFRVYCVNDDG